MKVGLSWLQEYVSIDVPTDRLVELLDLSGTKVEATHRPAGEIEGVVVAEVMAIEDHPNADNLILVDVSAGGGATNRVVCGARNFVVGDRVPLATVGARLPEMTIDERKIRGEKSMGMLCSAAELGISKDHSGILVLPSDATPGEEVVPLLGLDDTIIELEVTPNRPDCMSMIGVAREVAALLGQEVRRPDVTVEAKADLGADVKVTLEDPEGCPRYVARYVEGVKIAPSPSWMAARLLRAGIRPISNVVDVTNYVMLELGQPLHAFDATRIDGRSIVVRRARRGEIFKTLDGVDREMSPDDLMIADPKKALAIAGVMGGEESEISEDTDTVILESAYFDPILIALTARRHLMRTESSARFERGMDPAAAPLAAARAARLIAETAGAEVAETVVDEYPVPVQQRRIELRPSRVDKVLGEPMSVNQQISHLRSIDLEVIERAGGVLEVEIPTFRPDLRREVDLVEEVARLGGFERLPATLPPGRVGTLDASQRLERKVRYVLSGLGATEAWTSSFMSSDDLDALGLGPDHDARRVVRIANPASREIDLMRTTMLPGLLRSVARNLAHRAEGVALFEMARVYEPADKLAEEATILAGAFCGERVAKGWRNEEERWDFYAAKGIVEALCAALGTPPPSFSPVTGMPFHPGRAAQVSLGDKPVGAAGELHPDVCERFDAAEGTIALELGFAPLLESMPERVQAEELPKYPAAYLDIAVVVDEEVEGRAVADVIAAAGSPELVSLRLFDIYRGDQIEAGKKSLAYALKMRDPDRTLTDDEAATVRDRIVNALEQRTGARLRA